MIEHDLTSDGRTLRVREDGDPSGFAVIVHHGTPSAGLLYRPWVEDALHRGIRLIAYDRPGYGGSDRHEGRSVGDAAADVAAIADHLGIDRFATWGLSGGGPHTLACAALLPDRVTAVASLAGLVQPTDDFDLLAGMGEDNVVEFTAAREDPVALRKLIEDLRPQMLNASAAESMAAVESILSEPDKKVMTSELGEFFHTTDHVGFGESADGWFDDDIAFVTDWGFEVSDIKVPTLIVQGGQDLMVPPSHGPELVTRIPGAEAHFLPDEGHLTLVADRVPDVHEWLLGHSLIAGGGPEGGE